MIDIINSKKYIISLQERADRRIHLFNQFKVLGFRNFELYQAVNGSKSNYKGRLKLGQHGCKESHLNIVKKAQAEGLSHVIIIEDDAQFCDNFNSLYLNISIPKDWQMFYFGAHNFRKPDDILNGVGKCVTSLSTVCYAIRDNAYEFIIKMLEADKILDIIYCNDVHPSIKSYVAFPNLVAQMDGFSDIENANVSYRKFYNKWQ